jgi:ssDNA-binding Zn-finger/Zn-ribbon topoisomerase 1
MGAIQDIFRSHGPAYIAKYGERMPANHRKTIEAIIDCGSGAYGHTVYECEECGELHHINRSCGDRHCPTCQNGKALEWLDRQMESQLPGHHFMITFTAPECIRDFIRGHQRKAYGALFKASSESIKTLAKDERHIGGDLPGFTGILHTWGRQLQYHPHIHYVAPGGAFSRKDGRWHCSRLDFYLPVKALSKIYRAKFRDIMKTEGLFHLIDPKAWEIDWNVNIQAVGSGANTFKYLSLYVFKVAISDYRIDNFENAEVTFRYRKKGSNRDRRTTLSAEEFIRRYIQHVLPSGFMKVRRYGFANSNSSVPLEDIKGLVELGLGFEEGEFRAECVAEDYFPRCPTCGGKMKYRYSVLPYMMVPGLGGG